jgi:superoxide reductase
MELKFFRCSLCGQIIIKVHDTGSPLICCGKEMEQIKPNTVDASQEKHVPLVKIEGTKVTVHVGSVDHPMLPEHFIQWILLETNKGNQRKELKPGEKPEAVFFIGEGEKVLHAFAYCNLHSLWQSK